MGYWNFRMGFSDLRIGSWYFRMSFWDFGLDL
jgi:hypothetical protein